MAAIGEKDMTDLTPAEWLLLASIIYSGIVTGCLFGAWLKWWPAVQRDAARRRFIREMDRMYADRTNTQDDFDRIRAKFDEESA
jgi:hypothetical protein